ncbi:MAG: acyl-CoA dehydrogenase family protein [Cyanobacteria bacterium P01_D01_bin.105]
MISNPPTSHVEPSHVESSHSDAISAAPPALNSFLETHVLPVAPQLDTDASRLFEIFKAVGELGLLAPKLPLHWGGAGYSSQAYQALQAEIAARSGALAFLVTQHQSAASFLLSADNPSLKAAYLPAMATGAKRVGVGFSHLRRKTPPAVAQAVEGGYRLSGEIPWVTGAGLFEAFVGAAVLPTGEAVFGVLPLVSETGSTAGALRVSQPMTMAGMAATNTVRVQLDNWFLANEKVVGTRPPGWLLQRDRANPLSPLGLILGCAAGACRVLEEALERRQIEHGLTAHFFQARRQLTDAVATTAALPEHDYAQKIALRGRAIALMNQCAQAAMVAAGGAANGLHHPARRVYGEALVFSVSGQTNEGALATLDALAT